MPLSTLRLSPRGASRKTQGQDGVAFSFPVGLFHPLQHAGLSRRVKAGRKILISPVENSPALMRWWLFVSGPECNMDSAGEAKASNAGVQLAKE